MKKLIIPFVISIAFLAACQKEQIEQRPKWLSEKVDSVLFDKDLCNITTVTVFQFKGAYYYHIYCGVWSCMYCHIYDGEGNEISLNDETFANFMEENEKIDEFPACE